MRRRSNSHSPISLFTFLDTLVCTMGSLILMLLAMTPKIRERAEARELARLAALAPAVDPDPELAAVAPQPAPRAPELDTEKIAAERLKRRDAWLASLSDSRATLEKLQEEFRHRRQLVKETGGRLKDFQDRLQKARALDAEAGRAAQALTEVESRLEEQQAKIAQDIALTRRNIDLANRRQTEKPNEYVLVPYDGSSGTVRRPIYLECSRKGFRFLPEDETVSPVDLKGFQEGYNPLLTGTQALLRYWSRLRRQSGGAEPEPYVLLLIRPSGTLNYYVARGCLASLGANFGYELIEEDWKLSLPDADPAAKAILKQTLDQTVQARSETRDAFVDAAQRRGFGGPGNSGRGGFLDDANSGEDGDGLGGRSPTPGTRGNRQPSVRLGPATRRARDVAGAAPEGNAARNGAAGSRSGIDARDGTGTGTGARPGPGTDKSAGAATGGKPAARRPGGIDGGAKSGVVGRRGAESAVEGDPAIDAGGGDGADRDSSQSSRTPGTASSGGRSPGTGGGSGGSGAGADPSSGDLPREMGADGGTGRAPGGWPGRTGSRPATLGGLPADVDTGDGSADSDVPLRIPLDDEPRRLPSENGSGSGADEPFPLRSLPDSSSGRAARGASGDGVDGSLAQGSSSGSSRIVSPKSGQRGTNAESADGGSGSTDSDSTAREGLSGAPGPMGGPGVKISLGNKGNRPSRDKDDDPDAGPRLETDDPRTGGPRGRATGPRLWGRARPRATIGLERKLEVRIYDDRILIGSKDVRVLVGNGETVEEMIHQVVAGIDRAAEKWGDPPTSFYWLPTVRFVIYPGGNRYYERLHEPLERKWGVTSTVEYAPAKPTKSDGKTGANASEKTDARTGGKSAIQPIGGRR